MRRCVKRAQLQRFDAIDVLPQKVADARSKRELEQLRSVSSKSHKQRLEVCHLSSFMSIFISYFTNASPIRNSMPSCPRFQRSTKSQMLPAVDSLLSALVLIINDVGDKI
jgi:hypothetical protein